MIPAKAEIRAKCCPMDPKSKKSRGMALTSGCPLDSKSVELQGKVKKQRGNATESNRDFLPNHSSA